MCGELLFQVDLIRKGNIIDDMRITVVGLGAIGSAVAGFLHLKGIDVAGIGKGEHLLQIKKGGLRIKGIWGEHTLSGMEVYSSAEEGGERLKNSDFVIISTKSFDTERAVEEIAPFLQPDAIVASFQNGMGNMEIIAERIGKERTAGARVIFGSKITSPGEIEITVYGGEVLVGHHLGKEAPHHALEKVKKAAELLNSSGIPSQYVEDLKPYLWEKMLYNCALNPLSALFDVPYGVLYENEETRKIMEEVVSEIFEVALSEGVEMRWKNPMDYFEYFGKHLIPPTASHMASMREDLRRGSKTEIEFMNGYIVRMGNKRGIPVPVNTMLTLMIRFFEKRRRSGDGS